MERSRSLARSVEGGGFREGELELLLLGLGVGDGRLELAQLGGSRHWQRLVDWTGGNEEIPRKKGRWVAAARE